jgi:macrolide-specific efflux system membrane fusion protein
VNSPVSGRIDQVLVDEGDIVKPGDILAWISSEDRIALLDAAQGALESAQKSKDETAIKEAMRAYEVASNAYKPVPLTNSIKGEVIKRSVEPGQNVTTQTVLFVISDRLVANVSVDEADIGKITLNQDALVVLDAFPNESVPAKVTKISREAKVVSDVVVYNVMVEPTEVPKRWASGMTANVAFKVINKQDVLILPASALKERNGEKFVLVLSGNRQEPRRVMTGVTDGKMVEITEGVKEGDEVLVSGGSPSVSGLSPSAERRIRQMMRGMPGGFR